MSTLFQRTTWNILSRFGVEKSEGLKEAEIAANVEKIRSALTDEEFQLFMRVAFSKQANVADAGEKVDVLLGTRRNDDRTTFDLEVAFAGGWKGYGTGMYLDYEVVVVDPEKPERDERGFPLPIKAPNGTVVQSSSDDHQSSQELYKSDWKRANYDSSNPKDKIKVRRVDPETGVGNLALVAVRDTRGNIDHYEWPVIKCKLKPHFMFVCQVLVFDKNVNLALQGSVRRGTLTKTDVEKIYAQLNWVSPVDPKDLAACYVLMVHNLISPDKKWKQFDGLRLGGETIRNGGRRFHTYGDKLLNGRTPQWAVIDRICDHGISNWGSTSTVATGWGPEPDINPDATTFLEFLKDDIIYHLYDCVDRDNIEDFEVEEKDGTLNVKMVDDAFGPAGKIRLYSHRPPEDRDELYTQWHRRASVVEENKQRANAEEETQKWADVNKMFDSARGAYYRLPDERKVRRTAWLDYIDQLYFNWLTNEEIGLPYVEGTTRDYVLALHKEGLGKHHKEKSIFGNRAYKILQELWRFADARDSVSPYMLAKGGDARMLTPDKDHKFGSGYDPHPLCVGPIRTLPSGLQVYDIVRFDGHCLGGQHGGEVFFCEAKRPDETPREHYLRIRYGRLVARNYATWFNKITDHENWANDAFWAGAEKLPDYEAFMELKKEMIRSGTARSFLTLPFAIWALGANEEKIARAITEAKFVAQMDVLLSGVSPSVKKYVGLASADVWIDMMFEAVREVFSLTKEGKLKMTKESRQDFILKLNHDAVGYAKSEPWSKAGIEKMFLEVTGVKLDYGVVENAKRGFENFKATFFGPRRDDNA